MKGKIHIVNINATTIPDAWFQCIWEIIDHGFTYEIQQGSYVGDKRLEMDFVTIYISHPQVRPLEPDIPAHYGIPNPVEQGYIEQYLPYLMTDAKEPGEDYTYGQRIFAGTIILNTETGKPESDDPTGSKWVGLVNQVEYFIKVLRDTPNTNQAILQVGQPSDCLLDNPPCLRHIDIRIKDGKLIFYPYFRSWDLWGGFPANLGGMVYLQEYMADEIGIKPGPFICSSKGLHIYRYVWELARMRIGKLS